MAREKQISPEEFVRENAQEIAELNSGNFQDTANNWYFKVAGSKHAKTFLGGLSIAGAATAVAEILPSITDKIPGVYRDVAYADGPSRSTLPTVDRGTTPDRPVVGTQGTVGGNGSAVALQPVTPDSQRGEPPASPNFVPGNPNVPYIGTTGQRSETPRLTTAVEPHPVPPVVPPPPVDVCPNIVGNQPFVPAGLNKDAYGNCVAPPVGPPEVPQPPVIITQPPVVIRQQPPIIVQQPPVFIPGPTTFIEAPRQQQAQQAIAQNSVINPISIEANPNIINNNQSSAVAIANPAPAGQTVIERYYETRYIQAPPTEQSVPPKVEEPAPQPVIAKKPPVTTYEAPRPVAQGKGPDCPQGFNYPKEYPKGAAGLLGAKIDETKCELIEHDHNMNEQHRRQDESHARTETTLGRVETGVNEANRELDAIGTLLPQTDAGVARIEEAIKRLPDRINVDRGDGFKWWIIPVVGLAALGGGALGAAALRGGNGHNHRNDHGHTPDDGNGHGPRNDEPGPDDEVDVPGPGISGVPIIGGIFGGRRRQEIADGTVHNEERGRRQERRQPPVRTQEAENFMNRRQQVEVNHTVYGRGGRFGETGDPQWIVTDVDLREATPGDVNTRYRVYRLQRADDASDFVLMTDSQLSERRQAGHLRETQTPNRQVIHQGEVIGRDAGSEVVSAIHRDGNNRVYDLTNLQTGRVRQVSEDALRRMVDDEANHPHPAQDPVNHEPVLDPVIHPEPVQPVDQVDQILNGLNPLFHLIEALSLEDRLRMGRAIFGRLEALGIHAVQNPGQNPGNDNEDHAQPQPVDPIRVRNLDVVVREGNSFRDRNRITWRVTGVSEDGNTFSLVNPRRLGEVVTRNRAAMVRLIQEDQDTRQARQRRENREEAVRQAEANGGLVAEA